MAVNLDFFSTYMLRAILEESVPKTTFFRDRYFPTEAGDIFKADKVLTEYRKGDRKMACFVAPRVGDIPLARRGYEIHEYQPAYIGLSRYLTVDELSKRGFGEAIYSDTEQATRAARLIRDDLVDIDNRIARREEWMSAQTMVNNGCDMVEYIDANTKGDTKSVLFYDGDTSEHLYTVSDKWDADGADIFGDVRNMCNMLARRSLPIADLVLGSDVADALMANAEVRELLDRNSGIIIGTINQSVEYPGVARLGVLNFGGYMLTVWAVSESYEDENGNDTAYFPATAAMVTAPRCGHIMYGQITQIPYGSTEFETVAAKRVPKLMVDQPHDLRAIRIASRPLAAPKDYCPWIVAKDVVG